MKQIWASFLELYMHSFFFFLTFIFLYVLIDIFCRRAKCTLLFIFATRSGQDFPFARRKEEMNSRRAIGRTSAFVGDRCRLLEGDVFFLFSAPRLYGDSVPVNLIRTTSSKVRQKIVDTHNYFRTQVKPTAANMLVMVRIPFLFPSNKGEISFSTVQWTSSSFEILDSDYLSNFYFEKSIPYSSRAIIRIGLFYITYLWKFDLFRTFNRAITQI